MLEDYETEGFILNTIWQYIELNITNFANIVGPIFKKPDEKGTECWQMVTWG